MVDFNTDFRDFLLRNSHYTHMYENGLINDIAGHYAEAKARITGKLFSDLEQYGTGYTKEWRMQRLQNILDEAQMVMDNANVNATQVLADGLQSYGVTQADLIQGRFSGVGIALDKIPAEQVFAMVNEPMLGETFQRTMLWHNANAVREIRNRLTQAVITGEDMRTARNFLLGQGYRMNGKIGDLTVKRAEVIARTEIQRVSNSVSKSIYDANTDVLKGVQAVASLDRRTCLSCADVDGNIYLYATNIDQAPSYPLHPQCFIDHQIPIYTSKGYRPIGKIKKEDLVLTHKGRFRKVTDVLRFKEKGPKVVSIEIQYPTSFSGSSPKRKKLTLTEEHPLMINGKWIVAKEIKRGDKIKYLASRCARCNKIIPYDLKYCSLSCNSKDITEKQWANPKHREIVSKKNSIANLKQYASGERDRFAITKAANKKVRKWAARSEWSPCIMLGDKNPSKRPEFKKWLSESRKGSGNPMYGRKTTKETIEKRREFYRKNPDRHPNRIMAKKGHETRIEKQLREGLEHRKIVFESQFPIDSYFVDFAIPILKIAIEADGYYWHQNKERDRKRQEKIENLGWTVLRFSGAEINRDVSSCVEEIERICMNHSHEYEFMELEIVKVEHKKSIHYGRWGNVINTTLYNISVEEDESYVAKGFVSHNCRCTLAPITKSWEEMGIKAKDVPPEEQSTMKGNAPDTLTYHQWLQGQEAGSPGFAMDILGKNRYQLWKDGKIKLNEMVKSGKILTIDQLRKKMLTIPEEIISKKKILSPLNNPSLTQIKKLLNEDQLWAIEEWSASIQCEEIRAYQLNPKKYLNSHPPIWGDEIKELSDLLDEVIEKIPKSQGTFYRGLRGLSEETVKEFTTLGNTVVMDSISSFTDSVTNASYFIDVVEKKGNLILKIVDGKAANVSIAPIHKSIGISEYLIERGSNFKIVNVEETFINEYYLKGKLQKLKKPKKFITVTIERS